MCLQDSPSTRQAKYTYKPRRKHSNANHDSYIAIWQSQSYLTTSPIRLNVQSPVYIPELLANASKQETIYSFAAERITDLAKRSISAGLHASYMSLYVQPMLQPTQLRAGRSSIPTPYLSESTIVLQQASQTISKTFRGPSLLPEGGSRASPATPTMPE